MISFLAQMQFRLLMQLNESFWIQNFNIDLF